MRSHWIGVMAAAVLVVVAATGAGLPVTYERLLKSDQEPGNWLMYSGNYSSWRFSKLDQINTQNVQRLRPKWFYQARTREKVEVTPLVVDGIMYLVRPPNDVVALDAETGRTLWTFEYRVPPRPRPCCGQVNRGVAILDGRLFMNTVDAKVLALDAKTGRELWRNEMFDYTQGYAATGAPLALKDKVIFGMSGGELGVRGFLDAYDAATGKRVWRFYTIPGPGEPNFGTWEGESWKTGGATTWMTGSYDPALNTVYWGTSNPGPDYNGDVRKGDNLYSCSMLALDADTGQLKWYYQYTPHDTHDWDSTQIPILIDSEFRGRARKLLLHPNRNGFYYVLDRSSGEFLMAKPFVKQTWARGMDDKGRPMLNANTEPTTQGNDQVWPAVNGGNNWMSSSYSPVTRLLYIASREQRQRYTKTEAIYRPGEGFAGGGGGGGQRFAPEESWGKVIAIDPATAEQKWEHRLVTPPWSGVLSTAGNLVFGSTMEGHIFAIDARTGKDLWHFPGNEPVYASPMSYLSNGKQHIALAMGGVLISFAQPE
jgi:alcohol dehydrogenase (cytochrome c)